MPQFANDHDVSDFVTLFREDSLPNLHALAMTVSNLRHWTNRNSDGWAYWPKPGRAADKAVTILFAKQRENYRQDPEDISSDDLKAALRPIKAFLTRATKDGIDRSGTAATVVVSGPAPRPKEVVVRFGPLRVVVNVEDYEMNYDTTFLSPTGVTNQIHSDVLEIAEEALKERFSLLGYAAVTR